MVTTYPGKLNNIIIEQNVLIFFFFKYYTPMEKNAINVVISDGDYISFDISLKHCYKASFCKKLELSISSQ